MTDISKGLSQAKATAILAREEQKKMDKISDMRDRAVVVIRDIKSRYSEDEIRRDPGISCQKLFAEFIVMYTEDKL